jgi:putative ABC transport system substrate-binding protein
VTGLRLALATASRLGVDAGVAGVRGVAGWGGDRLEADPATRVTRRTFLGAVGVALLAAPLAVEAEQAGKVVRVGFLDAVSPRNVPWIAAFERRLVELGYVEGKNLAITFRTAEGRTDRLQDLATELVGLRPDVIVSSAGPDGTLALKHATSIIPVVFTAIEWDPVATGIVGSLGRPGSNLTGISAP